MVYSGRSRVEKASWSLGLGLALFAGLALPARAADGGGVVGWVEDARGLPVAGALVSLFGKGLNGGGLITVSDTSGRFMLPALPAGSYTVRALGETGATSRRVTVLPGRDSIFTLSFAPQPDHGDIEDTLVSVSPTERELRWLLRHKKRSVLEAEGSTPRTDDGASAPRSAELLGSLVPWLPELAGSVQWTASSALPTTSRQEQGRTDAATPSLGALSLQGRLGDGHWNLSGLLADADSGAFRVAAEFQLEPGGGQELRAGAGYGSWLLQPLALPASRSNDGRTVGALFLQDSWHVSDRLTADAGARYTYIGFLQDRNAVSPSASLEYRAGRRTRLRASSSARTLIPGGDILTLSTLATTPAMAIALVGDSVRPERILRHEFGVEHRVRSSRFGVFAFREGVRDRLVNLIDPHDTRSLRILNARGVVVDGAGVSYEQHVGSGFSGGITYTYGRSRPGEASVLAPGGVLGTADGTFQDVVVRAEALLDSTGTRVTAYYRINALRPQAEGLGNPGAQVSQRFDVQLVQVVPFLRSMTRAEWEVLLAFRNLFYEPAEAATLDEIAVVNPPTRVVGGISVRF